MKKDFAKAIIPLVIILNVIFTAAVLYVFYKTTVEPVALISAWFGFMGVEVWSLASIKRHKIKKDKGDDDV